jgi:small nuclear ribonucleoprotein (snRNP)-like protein
MEGQSFQSQSIPVSEDAYCNNTAAPSDGGSNSPAVAKLRKLLFRRMLIGVKDGRYFLGLFHCIDRQGNIILQDAVEYRSARPSSPPTEQRCLGLILIPAACRSSCQVDCSVEEKMFLLCLDE